MTSLSLWVSKPTEPLCHTQLGQTTARTALSSTSVWSDHGFRDHGLGVELVAQQAANPSVNHNTNPSVFHLPTVRAKQVSSGGRSPDTVEIFHLPQVYHVVTSKCRAQRS